MSLLGRKGSCVLAGVRAIAHLVDDFLQTLNLGDSLHPKALKIADNDPTHGRL